MPRSSHQYKLVFAVHILKQLYVSHQHKHPKLAFISYSICQSLFDNLYWFGGVFHFVYLYGQNVTTSRTKAVLTVVNWTSLSRGDSVSAGTPSSHTNITGTTHPTFPHTTFLPRKITAVTQIMRTVHGVTQQILLLQGDGNIVTYPAVSV